jgi:hypothetical protein
MGMFGYIIYLLMCPSKGSLTCHPTPSLQCQTHSINAELAVEHFLLLTQRNQTISYGATQLKISREQSLSLLSYRQPVTFRLVGISVLRYYNYEEFINRFLRSKFACAIGPPLQSTHPKHSPEYRRRKLS